jgi:hypothetical protein
MIHRNQHRGCEQIRRHAAHRAYRLSVNDWLQGFEVGLCTSTWWSLEIHLRWSQVRDAMANIPSIATIINGVLPLYLNSNQRTTRAKSLWQRLSSTRQLIARIHESPSASPWSLEAMTREGSRLGTWVMDIFPIRLRHERSYDFR